MGFLRFLKKILAAIGGFFGSIFSAEVNVLDNIHGIVNNYQIGKSQIEDGIERIRNFEFDPKWSSRVINVPIAIDHLRELYAEVFGDIKERFGRIVEPVHQLSLIFKAEHEQAGLTDAPAGLARTAVKVDEISTMIAQIKDATDSALTFTQAFDDIIINLESLDALFLQQTNPRHRVHLDDGTPIKLRIGNLHSR